ncbi:MAG: histidine--tRNA ligase [Paramuribaculum sp.]|nr:histidine--tRNA ligase [Paramuribaculum sp.]
MAQKPSIPKGTRDFGPEETAKRNYIFETIRDVFQLYGFSQIETPAMENLSTLMGKYGEEGDKLLFKILNSGNWMKDLTPADVESGEYAKLTSKVSEKGLRYDLTVPFARYVVQHRQDLTMPFKRYQIQPVWRADRPQKGRYREFYQCDADIVGSDSLINEVELLQMIDEVFDRLGIRIVIKLNNRKILTGIAEIIGEPDKLTDITTAIDKIEKIGEDKVVEELLSRGLKEKSIDLLKPFLNMSGTTAGKLDFLKVQLADSPTGLLGVAEMEEVINETESIGINAILELDTSLARGLNYYTGTIIEVKARDVEIGSISGGGRYDNLTGIFGMPGLSGVGISFGADRIYDVLNSLELFPSTATPSTEVMFVNFGSEESKVAMKMLKEMRKAGIMAEIYPDQAKMKKQMSYANDRNISHVAIVGEDEIKANKLTVKRMADGVQHTVELKEAIRLIIDYRQQELSE